MPEFDFEARRSAQHAAEDQTTKQQDEQNLHLNLLAEKLAGAVRVYAEGKNEIEISVDGSEVVITKKMEGFFLKLNHIMTISVDSEGTFAVRRGEYDKAIGANGQTGSLTEIEMIDAVVDWLSE